MKGKLVKIASNHSNLRTDEVDGDFPYLPEVGKVFVITGEPLSKEAFLRMVRTTKVKKVEIINPKRLVFFTQNSEYELYIS